jgi:tetratricopeptide (TPR) repeat protein
MSRHIDQFLITARRKEAIRLGKGLAALVVCGDTFRYRGEFHRALGDYDEAQRVDRREYVPAITGRGLTYERMGDLARARIEFERAIASQDRRRSDLSRVARETAQARLAALNSGAVQPVIPAAPSQVTSPTSIPTPAIAIPALPNSASAQRSRRVALVVGNSAYKSRRVVEPIE